MKSTRISCCCIRRNSWISLRADGSTKRATRREKGRLHRRREIQTASSSFGRLLSSLGVGGVTDSSTHSLRVSIPFPLVIGGVGTNALVVAPRCGRTRVACYATCNESLKETPFVWEGGARSERASERPLDLRVPREFSFEILERLLQALRRGPGRAEAPKARKRRLGSMWVIHDYPSTPRPTNSWERKKARPSARASPPE